MTIVHQGYLLGLGTNIEPKKNMVEMVRQLCDVVDQLTLSRVLNIPPVGMNSTAWFLNAVAYVETRLPETQFKQRCNKIEQMLGRDRTDPDRKHKDRPADIDILQIINRPEDWDLSSHDVTDEYFLYPCLDELKSFIRDTACDHYLPSGTRLNLDGLAFGEAPTTIYRQRNPGNERVIEHTFHR
jgi:2-amino-4-hydroxy-6-hydroxymethyldihydropteridine diphosphokinase